MSDWETFAGDTANDDDDSDPVMTTGDMTDGDTVTFRFESEPEVTDTEHGDAVRADVTFIGSTYDFETEAGDPFNEHDAVALLTWSKRLVRSLRRAAGDDPIGTTVKVTKHEGAGRYNVAYDAETVDADD